MNRVSAHLAAEIKINLSDISKEFDKNGYRILVLGEHLDIFATEEQFEELEEELDQKLHNEWETREYMINRIEELENKVSDLEDALEEVESSIRGELESDCEYDFYEAK